MKKYTFVVTSALSAMLLLSACNSTEDSNPVNEEETTGSVNEQTNRRNKSNRRKTNRQIRKTVQLIAQIQQWMILRKRLLHLIIQFNT